MCRTRINALFTIVLMLLSQTTNAIDLAANLGYGRFINNGKKYIEFYITVDGSTTNFVKNKNGKYQASIYSEISLSDKDGIRAFDKFNILSPEFDSLRNFETFGFQKRFFIESDSFTLNLTLDDINTPDSAIHIELPLGFDFKQDTPNLSDIQFLSSYKKTDVQNDYSKNGYELISYNSALFKDYQNTIKYYFELYNASSALPEGEDFVFFTFIRKDEHPRILTEYSRYIKSKVRKDIGQLGELSIKGLPSGNYQFIVEMRDRDNNPLARRTKFFQKINLNEDLQATPNTVLGTFAENLKLDEIRHYASSFRPLAEGLEHSSIETIENTNDTLMARNFIYNFCRKRNSYSTDHFWKELKGRIDEADRKYGNSKRRGYLCHMGRVLIKYGRPNRIETEFDDPTRRADRVSYPYQIWYYYQVANQSNRVFVFVNRGIGDNCYDLIHSDVNGEINIPDWNNTRNWKRQLQDYNDASRQIDYSRQDIYNR